MATWFPFNSLFEMRDGFMATYAVNGTQLSILYLRCAGGVGFGAG